MLLYAFVVLTAVYKKIQVEGSPVSRVLHDIARETEKAAH
jgi:hypothetical protein